MRKAVLGSVMAVALVTAGCAQVAESQFEAIGSDALVAMNPVLWADVPDPSVIRAVDSYYMSSTTMHMHPGVPIMRSRDLVTWELVNYAYDVLEDVDALGMRNHRQAYGQGTWASSLRHHGGRFYLATFSYTTRKTYVFTTDDIDRSVWARYTIDGLFHDMSLLFDDDGRVFMVYGSGDIRLIELSADGTSLNENARSSIIIPNAGKIAGDEFIVPAEGAHIHKIEGRYYVFLIVWPRDDMRTQLVYRADKLEGPYEGRILLRDSGIAQGGLIDAPDGTWYVMLFEDRGAVGRTPHLIPIAWQDGWPVIEAGQEPRTQDLQTREVRHAGIVASDDFDRETHVQDCAARSDTACDRFDLPLAWQWNHAPDDDHWSITERTGYLRLRNARIDSGFVSTNNTLTQRTFGPTSTATTALDSRGLADGDIAGLGLLQRHHGYVAARREAGETFVVMRLGDGVDEREAESHPFDGEMLYLRVDADFTDRADVATFHYSSDGVNWTRIGDTLEMQYTLPHFMGYRFALFSFAREAPGGMADFKYFRIGPSIDALFEP